MAPLKKGYHGRKTRLLPGNPGETFTGTSDDTELSAFSSDPAGYWRTADGQIMRIVDMSDNHLANAKQLVDGRLTLARSRVLQLASVQERMSGELSRRQRAAEEKTRVEKARIASEERSRKDKAEKIAQIAYQAALKTAMAEADAPKDKPVGRKFRDV